MGIENLKWWHWLVLALILGPLGAWVQLSIGPRGNLATQSSMGPDFFECAVLGLPRFGPVGPRVAASDIRLYPMDDGRYLVTMMAQADNFSPTLRRSNTRERRFVEQQLIRDTPYRPLNLLLEPPHFEVRFDLMDKGPGRGTDRNDDYARQAERLREARFEKFDKPAHGVRDPGPHEERGQPRWATIALPLKRADCELLLRPASASMDAAKLYRAQFNGKDVPPLTATREGFGVVLRASIPASSFTNEPLQTLSLARTSDRPVPLRGIEIVNPTYTLRDFLEDAKQRNPNLAYTYKATWRPAVAYPVWTAGSVLAIGVVWPVLLRLLTGAGFGRQPKEPEYDLSRFKGEPQRAKAAAVADPAADARLIAMTSELEAKLMADAKSREASTAVAEPEKPLRQLKAGGTVAEVTAGDDTEEHKEYGGEYYPVVRKVERVEKKH